MDLPERLDAVDGEFDWALRNLREARANIVKASNAGIGLAVHTRHDAAFELTGHVAAVMDAIDEAMTTVGMAEQAADRVRDAYSEQGTA